MELRIITKEQLEDILEKHKKWLDNKDGAIKADLSSADLRYADLSSANLRSANLSYADLRSANLSSADLSSADLRYADLSYANLRSANLSYADLRSANLSYADLDKTYLQISCIGSRKGMTTYCFEDDIILCGCWAGTLKEFKSRVKEIHQYNYQYLNEYLGFIKYIKFLIKNKNKK